MPVMDEFREEREAIRHGTPKQKYQYFKDYYRMPLIIIIIACVFVGILVYHFVTHKDSAFYAAMLNCSPYPDNEWFTDEYSRYASIDTDRYSVTFDTGIYFKLNSTDEDTYITVQKLDAYTGVGQLDVMLGGGDEFAHFANSILFHDLRTVLTEEQIARYEPFFYYIDAARLDSAPSEASASTEYADPRKPEEMEDPIPVAIYVENSQKLNAAYYFKNAEDGIALGIYSNTSHPDNAAMFIDYLLTDQAAPSAGD